jgi:hypothetical protein
VRDQDQSQQDIEEALRRSVPEILRSYPLVRTVDGMKRIIAIESKVIWCWDEDSDITLDEQIFRRVYSQEEPTIETLLDRPLLGLSYIDELMYGRQGLSKLAMLDLTDRGGCVAAQIYELAEKKKAISSPGAQKNGKDTRKQTTVKRFKTLKWKTPAFRLFNRSCTFATAVRQWEALRSAALSLLRDNQQTMGYVRLLGLSVSNLEQEQAHTGRQLQLPFAD